MVQARTPILLLLCICLLGLSSHASAKDCTKKASCVCQCDFVKADGRGNGPCSIAENGQNWCTISYSGSTGSLGPGSFGPPFSTKTQFFDDHRSPAYAKPLANSIVAACREGEADLELGLSKLFLSNPAMMAPFIRASYVSSPKIDQSTVEALDELLALLFKTKGAEVVKTFFDRSRRETSIFAVEQLKLGQTRISVGSGYLRIPSKPVTVEFISREFVPE